MSNNELRKIRYGLGVGIVLLVAMLAVQIATTLNPARPALIESWTISVAAPAITIGDPIELVGSFQCTEEALAESPPVQFRSELSAAGTGGWSVPRPVGPARTIVPACSSPGDVVPFTYAWNTDLERAVRLLADDGDLIEVRIAVTAEGWQTASAVTPPAPLRIP